MTPHKVARKIGHTPKWKGYVKISMKVLKQKKIYKDGE